MENNTQNFKFKTNINCGGCVATVKPHLDKVDGIAHWEVDTDNREKILTVSSDGVKQQDIIQAVQQAGYKIEEIEG